MKTQSQPQQPRLGFPSWTDSYGKSEGRPGTSEPLRRFHWVNAPVARCLVFLAPIALTACQPAVLDPQGVVGIAEKTILIDLLAIMLAIVVPTIAATLAFAWWFRASNTRARYLPDWVYSGRIELIVWSIPLLAIMLLGGVAWIGSHDLDPARPLPSEDAHRSRSRSCRSIGNGSSSTPSQGVASVNRLVIPAGVPVHFTLTSASVMNAFFVPQLGSMIYTMNGMTTQLNLQADTPGTFRGLSSHYSGDGFSDMHFDVQAVPAEGFAAWIEATRNTGPTLDPRSYTSLRQAEHEDRSVHLRCGRSGSVSKGRHAEAAAWTRPTVGRPNPGVSPRTEK